MVKGQIVRRDAERVRQVQKILLIEDDLKILEHLRDSLYSGGYLVEPFSKLVDAVAHVEMVSNFDIIILDRLFNGQDSKPFIPFFKHKCQNCYILIISAINTPDEKSSLLDLGADDYIGKPFSTLELMSRIKALLRRSKTNELNFNIIGNTLIDYLKRTITVDDKVEFLTPKEFMLFKTLSQQPGRSYNRIELFELVWGGNSLTETNVVEATVTHLRRKLESCGSSIQLRNLRNAGYWIEI